MATRGKYAQLIFFYFLLLWTYGVNLAENLNGLEIKCGEISIEITAKRGLFLQRRIPFKPNHVRLGLNSTQQRSCVPREPLSESEMVISARLQECGTESNVRIDE